MSTDKPSVTTVALNRAGRSRSANEPSNEPPNGAPSTAPRIAPGVDIVNEFAGRLHFGFAFGRSSSAAGTREMWDGPTAGTSELDAAAVRLHRLPS